MIPLVDTHCHILAGLDDGARDDDEALRMCEIAVRDGVQVIAATAHQSGIYPKNSAERIGAATRRLAERLKDESIPLTVFPCGEVALADTLIDDWNKGLVQPLGIGKSNVLLEYPNGYPGDFLKAAETLLAFGIRPTVAHAERYSTLLNSSEKVEALVRMGCLIQVSTAALDDDQKGPVHRTVKNWVKHGMVHVVGSDAHDSFRRRPGMSSAYAAIAKWTSQTVADRICSLVPLALLRGLRINADRHLPVSRPGWSLRSFGLRLPMLRITRQR